MRYGLIFAVMSLVASPLSAANVTANAGQIVKLLDQQGYGTELTEDSIGDPLILSGANGQPFFIYFYGCDDGEQCKTVLLHAYFETDEPVPLERINRWNRENRFGKAFLDEDGDVALEMDIDLEGGGMSEALFLDNLQYWEAVLDDLSRYLD